MTSIITQLQPEPVYDAISDALEIADDYEPLPEYT
jgi:hypothetical protein